MEVRKVMNVGSVRLSAPFGIFLWATGVGVKSRALMVIKNQKNIGLWCQELFSTVSLASWPQWKFHNCVIMWTKYPPPSSLSLSSSLLLCQLQHDRIRKNLWSWLTVQRVPLSYVITYFSIHLSARGDGSNMAVTTVRQFITALMFSVETKLFPCCVETHSHRVMKVSYCVFLLVALFHVVKCPGPLH